MHCTVSTDSELRRASATVPMTETSCASNAGCLASTILLVSLGATCNPLVSSLGPYASNSCAPKAPEVSSHVQVHTHSLHNRVVGKTTPRC